MRRIGRILLGLLVAVVCAAGILLVARYSGGPSEYARFKSPDGRFELVVYRQPVLFAMPGQGSDAPGTVVLQTSAGEELQRTPVSMVQLVSEPRWDEDKVSVKLLLDWALPSGGG
ncbi:MAG: hypothetical protein AAGI06_02565 [Pseudomonadota bacterium]